MGRGGQKFWDEENFEGGGNKKPFLFVPSYYRSSFTAAAAGFGHFLA